ncbi:rhamnogalacturonan acetylesterase [Fulvivirga sediminis]|uniref:Rhamnogalacturonan acetylesterase n=1 Tax=Fulvivirga sediminis TaxID=2803949 RepID=A0A937JY52_9BACT|nr:rhamnogalacturonan acetylesterase [Fulvivirga sediminis]MBL3656108.1 rhamnogalacturonan acetylesterase [Fulvivirga sediminis]
MKSFILLIFLMPLSILWQGNDITIFLVADSTVADKPYKDGNPEKGWGQVFPLYFKEGIQVDNHAVNGRSTKSFMDEGRWDKVLSLIEPGDYVIIEFGHNDEKEHDPNRYADPDNAYRANLKKYIADARVKGAKPILATPIVRRKFNEQGEFVESHGKYPQVVREVAKSEKVPLLDMQRETKALLMTYGEEGSEKLFLHIKPGEYPLLPEGRDDDTHLSPYGAFRVADLVVAEIKKNVPELASYLKE